ncbi:hypothetical protein T484DRAFT_3647910 [Baffinella frigidus]|nr:hypothetical protein T484DRAFT_3647910 [Cryptophyta sp. CCMP2293]
MNKMLKAIRGFPPQRKSAEEDMSMEALMTGQSTASCSPLARPNSFDPAMAGNAACDRSRGMPGVRSFDPANNRGMLKSGSFDPAMLPRVSLPFLHSADSDTSSLPPSRANARLNDAPTNHRRKTPPMSPLRQAAIQRCIAAIEECKTLLAESTEDRSLDACHNELPLRAGQTQGASPLEAGSPQVESTIAGGSPRSPLPESPPAGGPRLYRTTPYIRRRGSAEPVEIMTADPSDHYSEEEAVWAGLDGVTDAPPADRTLPEPAAPPHDAFVRLSTPPRAAARLSGAVEQPSRDASWEPRGLRARGRSPRARGRSPRPRPRAHAGGEEAGALEIGRCVVEPVVFDEGQRVFRTTPYIRRGGAPTV